MSFPRSKKLSPFYQIRIPRHLQIEAESAARKAGSLEACALLTGYWKKGYRGKKSLILEAFYISDNVSDEPDKGFEIDAKLQVDLHKKARSGLHSVVGVWHSHPSGDEKPSEIDALAAHDPDLFWWISAERNGTMFHSYQMAPVTSGGVFREVALV